MQFKTFPGESTGKFALEVNELISTALSQLGASSAVQSTQNYFIQFNQDVAIINKLLMMPPSSGDLDRVAFLRQEEFNEMWDFGQRRWIQSGSNSSVANSVIKQAAQKANEYKEAMASKQHYEARKLKITEYLSKEGWKPLLALASEKECKAAVLLLQADWIKQAQFAYFDSKDLVLILKELKNFNIFLRLIQSGLSDASHPVISRVVNNNVELLRESEVQLAAAIAWRMHAASLRGNLWFDDCVWALNQRLTQLLAEYDYKDKDAILSRNLSPDIAGVFIKFLQRAQHIVDRDKWFSSRWVVNTEGEYPIKVIMTPDLEIIPAKLAHLIPDEPRSIDDNIRYFYFRGRNPESKLGAYLKKKSMGNPYLIITFLNEASSQITAFSEAFVAQENFVLSKVTRTPGFKSALLFPSMIAKERERINFFIPKNVLLRGVVWLPQKILQNKTQVFFSEWQNLLNKIEKNILSKTNKIASKLVLNLEASLVQEIKNKLFSFPKDLIVDLSRFIELYGTDAEKKRFKEIISPAYLFKQFQLLTYIESNPVRQLDQGAVFIFLRYAQLYWTTQECEAAHEIANLLAGTFPKNAAEDERLLLSLSSWFCDQIEVNAFLHNLSIDFIVQIGSRANPLAYRFLKLHSVEALKLWERETDHDLYKKYSLLIDVLEKPLGSEVDLYLYGKAKEVDFIGDLRRNQSSHNYIGALRDSLGVYLRAYDGSNGMYAELVFHLCQENDVAQSVHRYFESYFTARIRYIAKNFKMPPLQIQELSLYHDAHPTLGVLLEKVILQQNKGNFLVLNANLHLILSPIRYPELLGVFSFNRMSCLLEVGDFDAIYAQSNFFDKKNMYFNDRLMAFFKAFFKTPIFESVEDRLRLDWIIEYYADQQTKEENRYLAIKRFLGQANKTDVVNFIEKQKFFLVNKELSKFFSLETYKLKLADLYKYHTANMFDQKRGGWNPYAQYLMESLAYPQTGPYLFVARLAWLNQFLFHLCPTQAGGIPMTVHLKNLIAPNEQISIKSFFGPECIQAQRMVFQYLTQKPVEIHERKIKLISRYLEEDVFRKDEHWEEMSFKIGILKSAVSISDNLKKNEWDKAKEGLTDFRIEANPRYGLLTHTQNVKEIQMQISYCEGVFKALKEKLKALDEDLLEAEGIIEILQVPLSQHRVERAMSPITRL